MRDPSTKFNSPGGLHHSASNLPAAKNGAIRRILQPLLMLLAVFSAVVVVGATLRGRPDIPQPSRATNTYLDADFQVARATANSQLAKMAGGMETAPAADNLTIARRISLALVGSGLSLEEYRTLSSIPEERQIQWWTSYLLQDPRWEDYFAERFSRAFVGTNDGPFLLFRRRKLNAWLSDQFADGVGYDKIVRSMISADGLWTDTPQVNFVTATMDDANKGRADPIRLAGRTSRAFLAQRIDCLQCHDDFLGQLNFGTDDAPVDGRQDHFHTLAAFYAGTAIKESVPFRGISDDGREYRYKYLGESEESIVEPAVPFLPELLPPDGQPRSRLARWVTHPKNRAFSRATVNRVWALLFSRPLVEPVDSIPLDDSIPPILDTLANDFVAHGFDLKRLVRLIIETDAFQRDSRAEFEITEKHEAMWAVFPITQLRPEQVAGRLFQACKLTAIDETSSIVTRLKAYGDTQDFLKRFGDRGEDEFESDAVTITQRLVVMNGNLVADRTKNDLVNNACARIARLVADDERAIELAFLSVLNRTPTAKEQQRFGEYLSDKRGDTRARAVGDIYWAMINSTEFSWNH